MDQFITFVKKNLRSCVGAFLGLFQFVFFALPYLNASVSYGEGSESESISGYECFGEKLFDMDAGFLPGIFHWLALFVGIALFAVSAYTLVRKLFVSTLPEQFGGFSVALAEKLALLAYGAANAMTFLGFLIVSIANSESEEFMGIKIGVSFFPHVGIWLLCALAVGAFFALRFLEKKMPAGASVKSVCEKCGASAKEGQAFCAACGGKIVEKKDTSSVCPTCGAKLKEGAAFCTNCGNKIAEKKDSAVCSACGAALKEGAAFCTNCGNKAN